MENFALYETGQVIYPGQYVPILSEEKLHNEIKHAFKTESVLPKVNITELADSYIAELTIPGVSREDFLIHTDDNILTVCVLHKGCSQQSKSHIPKHEFNYGLCDRHIILPDNADAAFISAEYSAGTLRFHVQKTKHPVKNFHSRIVVY